MEIHTVNTWSVGEKDEDTVTTFLTRLKILFKNNRKNRKKIELTKLVFPTLCRSHRPWVRIHPGLRGDPVRCLLVY